ncbi:multidrug transporter [Marinomonas sp. SBI22]|uniref:DMT family transporter n=1 Tax=unclassified Marinomonas TaxID=196814 RepID=UPI0007AF5115|nr:MULTISPECIES: DMT family transporter [unclassified Marinomonas]KZM43003.1 multidrug transporter [Marinomonas sp. SBI22]KZM44573.1 multidrug transporter [Marinomonas sp. SBI8L]
MWIAFTLLAAWFQSMRTAYQNSLSKQEGTLHATLARSLFGLPFVLVYGGFCYFLFGPLTTEISQIFYLIAGLGALAQILATYLMLYLFKQASFTSGTLFAKTEALLAALLAAAFLGDKLSWGAWLAIAIGVIGIGVLSFKHSHKKMQLLDKASLLGLASGFCFALTSVSAGYASSMLEGPVFTRAAFTLAYVLALQSVLLWGIQIYQTKSLFIPFKKAFLLSNKVGCLSALGSIGWFTAFSLINPALVKTLGQIEVIGTLYYSKYRFKEALSKQEWIGGSLIILSVIIVALLG